MAKKFKSICIFALENEIIYLVTTVFLAIILLLAAVVLLGVKVLFVKGGKFPSGHVHDSPELRKKGITCSRDKDTH